MLKIVIMRDVAVKTSNSLQAFTVFKCSSQKSTLIVCNIPTSSCTVVPSRVGDDEDWSDLLVTLT